MIKLEKKILVTSALPYVNNIPHLGTMVCIISADVYTRFLKLQEKKAISILGTDEHGTTTETIALKLGMTPKEATDHFYKIHKQIYDWFNCEFDCFGRTSCPESTEITQDIFLKLYENGYIIEKEEEQFYDDEAQKFLSDRFIEGECPHCKYKDARGDQCDACGKLLDPKELKNPKSKLTGTKPELKKTKHLYIKLQELQPLLEDHINKIKNNWTENAITTTNAWLREGLRERAITRDLKWGIKVPLKDYEEKVFYVWFDAPIGYIAITKANRKDWQDWWHNPEETKLVQFMGKDNTPFHSVLFPSSLIGTKQKYTLVDTLNVNEYLNYENDKFSKSRGIGIFGDNIQETGIPADAWRYYLIMNRPERTDTMFSWKDFQDKVNNEIVGNFANLINRTLTFIKKFSDGKIEKITNSWNYEENIQKITKYYEDIELKRALKEIMTLSKKANQYFQEQEPWKKIKEQPALAKNDLAILANIIKDLAILIEPIMPQTSKDIYAQLNIKKQTIKDINTKLENHEIGDVKPLFSKIEDKKITEFKEKYSGKQENTKPNLSALKKPIFKVAQITNIEKHPDADKLYIEKINLGTEERTIVSGLADHYNPEELIGKKIIVVTNLKPAILRGVKSEGMLLAASQGKKVGLLLCPEAEIGTQIKYEGIEPENKEITIEEFFEAQIHATTEGIIAEGKKLIGAKIIVDKDIKGKVK
ncbi:MAG: methionine--tRNA ligase [Candidatus Woesearchaeota archaeon]